MKVTLEITADDFDRLTNAQMRWAGTDWAEKNAEFEHRFEPLIEQTKIDYGWAFAFWCTTYSEYLLCAAYLKSVAEPHQGLWDSATSQIVILSDFAGFWDKL